MEALRRLTGINGVEKLDGEPQYRIGYNREKTDTNAILKTVIAGGGRVVAFQEDLKQLNQAFMDLTEPGVPA